MRKFILIVIALLIAVTVPFSTLAASWPSTPYFPQQVEFRHDHKYDHFSSFTGPGGLGVYSGGGTYYNNKITSVMALWKESVDGGNYIYIEFRSSPSYFRRLYVQNMYFSTTTYIPNASLSSVQATVIQPCTAYYGPGTEYDKLEKSDVASETDLSVFFEEDGYVFAEFYNGMGHVRAYIPSNCVSGGGSYNTSYSIQQPQAGAKFCTNCGFMFADNTEYKFCPNCGTAITR